MVAAEFTLDHALKRQVPRTNLRDAARTLLEAVEALPEVRTLRAEAAPPPPRPEPPEPTPPKTVTAPSPSTLPRNPLARLEAAAKTGPIVVVGGSAQWEKLAKLPEPIREIIEWLEITHDGTVPIGGLEKRIREGRVVGIILLEGLVYHRHSDPLVSSSRQAGVPLVYAGRGSQRALREALDSLDRMVRSPV